jgi:PAS domain S-box-containing protein
MSELDSSQQRYELDSSAQQPSSTVWRYGFAVSSVGVALFITHLLRPDAFISPIFFLAVMLSAWIGGFGPGLTAALLATFSVVYFFLPPQSTLGSYAGNIPHLLVFFVSAFMVSSWSAGRRRAQSMLQQAHDELEIKVQERTADLSASNKQLQAEIGERKRVEESLLEKAGLLDLTHDTVFVRDMNDVIRYWNRGAEELYGWKKEEALGQISHKLTKTVFPAPKEEIQEEFLKAGRWEGELTHTRRDGGQVIVASRWSLQRDQNGEPATVLETNNDITERKRAEADLQKAHAELAHVTRVATLGELTASIAHEVNQPLAGVVTNGNACLRWLACNPPNMVEAQRAIERIIKDGHRAGDVIVRIRALVKKTPSQRISVNVNEAIRDVIALARSEMHSNRVLLKTELSDHLPSVFADRVQLQQVILNLVINAREAVGSVREGPRELTITSTRDDAGGVLVGVRDSGVGLDVENLDQVFDAFFTTKPDGMGMGLAISRSIIEAHGGRLWATANTPRGAVFQFTLPPPTDSLS